VSQWVDYSKKYGVGYKLSDGTTGVFFNDNSTMVLDAKQQILDHIVNKRDLLTGEKCELRQSHFFCPKQVCDSDKDFVKKTELLKHFKEYLNRRYWNTTARTDASMPRNMVYVFKWMRTRHCMIFRLSNNDLQINFFDGTEVFLWANAPFVTYLDKSEVRKTFQMSGKGAEEQMPKMPKSLLKRLRHIDELSVHI
jgi:polo-like kinase 1